jgi:hypothetical protein
LCCGDTQILRYVHKQIQQEGWSTLLLYVPNVAKAGMQCGEVGSS